MRVLRLILIAGASVAALALLVVVLVARNPERRVARLLDEAQIHKRTGDLAGATASIEQAVALRPNDAGLRAKLARSWAARGDLEKAKLHLLEAITVNPDDVEGRFDLFEIELERGELDLAAEQLGKLDEQCRVLASEAARDRCHAARASLLLRRGEMRPAARELENALGVNPAHDAQVRVALAGVMAALGDVTRAEKLARDVWETRRPLGAAAPATDEEKLADEAHHAPEPFVGRAGGFLARILLDRGDPDGAVAIASESWARAPEDGELALVVADAEIARHGYEPALAVGKKLDERNLHGAASLVRGRVARARGDVEAARSAFREAVRSAPGAASPALAAADVELAAGEKEEAAKLALSIDGTRSSLDERVVQARILRDCGRLDEARRTLHEVLAAAPGHPGAIELLVLVELAGGHPESVGAEIEDLAKRSPGNGFLDRARTLVALWRQDPGAAAAIERRAFQASRGEDASAAELMTAALVLEGGVGSAVHELERVASESPENELRARARLQAAELYLALGRADLALPVLERGVAEQPRRRDLRIAAARTFVALGRGGEAVTTLGPLLDTKEPEAFLLAARACLVAHRFAEAQGFARGAQQDPAQGADALSVLGLASRELGDRVSAREAFAKLRALRPSAPLGYAGSLIDLLESPGPVAKVLEAAVAKVGEEGFGADLAVALDLAARTPEAVAAAHAASGRTKLDPSAAYAFACVLARHGQPDEAALVLGRGEIASELRTSFRELSPDALAELETLVALRRHGLDQEGAEAAARLAEQAPTNLVAGLHVGRALAVVGRAAEGERLLAKAIAAAPPFASALIELATLRRKTSGGAQGSLATFREALVATPRDPSLQLALGVTLSELEQPVEAEAAYRAVLAADSSNPIARNNLAWLLLEKGTSEALEEGATLAKAAVTASPDDPFPLDTLARLELARGEPKPALEHERKAVERAPANATIRFGLGRALEATGDVRGAANEYEIALLLAASFDGRAEAESRLAALRGASPHVVAPGAEKRGS